MTYKVVAGFHRGSGTEFKSFYLEVSSLEELDAFTNKKVSEGWTSCGVMMVDNDLEQKSPPVEKWSKDWR